jgi:hypothetical protein
MKIKNKYQQQLKGNTYGNQKSFAVTLNKLQLITVNCDFLEQERAVGKEPNFYLKDTTMKTNDVLNDGNISYCRAIQPNTIIRRSTTMLHRSNIIKGVILSLMVLFIAGTAISQHLIISGSNASPISGSGTFNIKGNLQDSVWTGGVTLSIPSTVVLNGSTQTLGGHAQGDAAVKKYSITRLRVGSSGDKTFSEDTLQAVDSLTLDAGALNVSGKALYISDASSKAAGSITTNGSSTVIYNKNSGSQAVLGLTYSGALKLIANATKSFGGAVTVAGAFTHENGNVTVDQNVELQGAVSTYAIADVSATKTLTLSGTGSKQVRTLTANSGTVDNTGASLLTIDNLNGNSSAINGGPNGITFTNAATNAGNITGAAGALTFSSTLATSSGTITAGDGGATFTGGVTKTGGNITGGAGAVAFSSTLSNSVGNVTAGAGGMSFAGTVTLSGGVITSGSGLLDFNGDVDNSSGTLSLTSSATANFAGSLNATGLSFSNGSTVTFDGGSQTVPAVSYGNLTLGGSASKTAGGDLTINGNLVLNRDITVGALYALSLASASSGVSGSYEVVGKVTRTHDFAAATEYAFNRSNVTLTFESLESADVTLGMYPGTNPSGTIGSKYVGRKYTVSSSADLSANNAAIKLYYVDSERQNSPTETRLGFKKYDGASWTKLTSNGGSYTRNVGSDPNTISLNKVNQGFSGVTEIGMAEIEYITIATGDIRAASTWGGTTDDVPQAVGEVGYVRHSVTTNGTGSPVSLANASIVVETGYSSGLTVSSNDLTLGSLEVQSGKSATVNASRTLTVNNNLSNTGSVVVNGTGALQVNGTFTNIGTITNDGTITVGQ